MFLIGSPVGTKLAECLSSFRQYFESETNMKRALVIAFIAMNFIANAEAANKAGDCRPFLQNKLAEMSTVKGGALQGAMMAGMAANAICIWTGPGYLGCMAGGSLVLVPVGAGLGAAMANGDRADIAKILMVADEAERAVAGPGLKALTAALNKHHTKYGSLPRDEGFPKKVPQVTVNEVGTAVKALNSTRQLCDFNDFGVLKNGGSLSGAVVRQIGIHRGYL